MSEAARRHIVIAGNIGVGKSTLVTLLARELGWAPAYELEGAHPYLDDYYADPRRWSFHTQIWFLTRRLTQHRRAARLSGTVVQDRSIYEDSAVFAASLYAQGILGDRDYATYQQLYEEITGELRPPDLVVYLRASVPTLLKRIARRARPAEQAIQPPYLASLERHYEAWLAGWTTSPVLTLDTDQLDVVLRPEDGRLLINSVVTYLEERNRGGKETES